MTALLGLVGAALILATLTDVVWTTIAAGSGAGPLTARITRRGQRLALGLHRRWSSPGLLSVAGVAILLLVLLSWLLLVFIGWALILGSAEGAVRSSSTAAPADLWSRLYFIGYTMLTLGNGEYRPGQGLWQFVTVIVTGTGLVLVTLSITYLVPVASAVSERRALASHIASMGTGPHAILLNSWTGAGFGSLPQHLVSLTSMVHTVRQQHLAYPVLHYFHSLDPQSAAPPNLARLSQALDLAIAGLDPEVRPDPAALLTLDEAIGSFLATLHAAHLTRSAAPIPPPELGPLRAAGIPVVSDETYAGHAPDSERRRSLLAAFLRDDGWPPDAAA